MINTASNNVETIEINQVEGREGQMIHATVMGYEAANALLIAIAHGNTCEFGSYRKVEVTTTLKCGEVLKTRHCVKPYGTENNDLDVETHNNWLVEHVAAKK